MNSARVILTKNGTSIEVTPKEAAKLLQLKPSYGYRFSNYHIDRFKNGDYMGYHVEYISSGKYTGPVYVYKDGKYLGKEKNQKEVCKKYHLSHIIVKRHLENGSIYNGYNFYKEFQK